MKTVSNFQSLTIFAEKAPSYMFDRVPNTPVRCTSPANYGNSTEHNLVLIQTTSL